jgi:hypothetical protein
VQTPRFCGDCCNAGTFLRDFCTVRGFAISWLIVGMSAFTLLFTRGRGWLRKFFSRRAVPFGPLHAGRTHAKRNRANHPSLSGKRFDATEDRD